MHLIVENVATTTVFALGLRAVALAVQPNRRTPAFSAADMSVPGSLTIRQVSHSQSLSGDLPRASLLTVGTFPCDPNSLFFSAESSLSPPLLT